MSSLDPRPPELGAVDQYRLLQIWRQMNELKESDDCLVDTCIGSCDCWLSPAACIYAGSTFLLILIFLCSVIPNNYPERAGGQLLLSDLLLWLRKTNNELIINKKFRKESTWTWTLNQMFKFLFQLFTPVLPSELPSILSPASVLSLSMFKYPYMWSSRSSPGVGTSGWLQSARPSCFFLLNHPWPSLCGITHFLFPRACESYDCPDEQ